MSEILYPVSATAIFADPPTPGHRQGPNAQDMTQGFICALRDKPGRWAIHPTWRSGGPTTAVNRGEGVWRVGRFEATSRKMDGETRVYVRYLGAST